MGQHGLTLREVSSVGASNYYAANPSVETEA
jgi:hypothetical protein